MVKDDRSSCWTKTQKRNDPYLQAWLDQIPLSTPTRAVWEFNRGTNTFDRYSWAEMTPSHDLPQEELDRFFTEIGHATPHPYFRWSTVGKYFLFIHIPIILIDILYLVMVYHGVAKEDRNPVHLMVFNSIIHTMSGVFVGVLIWLSCEYRKDLDARQRSIQKVCDEMPRRTGLGIAELRITAGKYGAWVEASLTRDNITQEILIKNRAAENLI